MRAAANRTVVPALLLGFAAAGTAAYPQQDTAGFFQETIDVRVVNVEIVVTDRQGGRVAGLESTDFRLLVDGEPVAIEYFTEIAEGRSRGGTAAGPGSAGPRALPAGETVATNYLVFIDDYFAIGAHRDFALERLGEQLPLLRPDDRLAVVAFAGLRIDRLCGWSGDPKLLRSCLRAARERPARGLFRATERRRRGLATVPGGGAFAAAEEDLELQRVVDAVAATMRGFPQPPGRKVLLLLAGAWPSFERFRLVESAGGVASDLELLRDLTETANLLGYTVYPLGLPGLRAAGADVAQAQAPQTEGQSPATAEVVRQSGLRYVADRTGGRALLFADRTRPLEAVAADTSSYYWLGFTPQREGDDGSHDIRVEVLRPGLRARARRGFVDLSAASEQALLVESALLFRAAAGDNDFVLRLGRSRRVARRRVEVGVEVELPVGELAFLPAGDGWQAAVELRLGVLDGRGGRSEVLVTPIQLTRPRPPAAGEVRTYRTRAVLRRTGHDVVATLHDRISGRVLISRVEWRP